MPQIHTPPIRSQRGLCKCVETLPASRDSCCPSSSSNSAACTGRVASSVLCLPSYRPQRHRSNYTCKCDPLSNYRIGSPCRVVVGNRAARVKRGTRFCREGSGRRGSRRDRRPAKPCRGAAAGGRMVRVLGLQPGRRPAASPLRVLCEPATISSSASAVRTGVTPAAPPVTVAAPGRRRGRFSPVPVGERLVAVSHLSSESVHFGSAVSAPAPSDSESLGVSTPWRKSPRHPSQ